MRVCTRKALSSHVYLLCSIHCSSPFLTPSVSLTVAAYSILRNTQDGMSTPVIDSAWNSEAHNWGWFNISNDPSLPRYALSHNDDIALVGEKYGDARPLYLDSVIRNHAEATDGRTAMNYIKRLLKPHNEQPAGVTGRGSPQGVRFYLNVPRATPRRASPPTRDRTESELVKLLTPVEGSPFTWKECQMPGSQEVGYYLCLDGVGGYTILNSNVQKNGRRIRPQDVWAKLVDDDGTVDMKQLDARLVRSCDNPADIKVARMTPSVRLIWIHKPRTKAALPHS
jgi:hypothetical protein